MVVVPEMGRLSWTCDDGPRFALAFTGTGTTVWVSVHADGRRMASGRVGARRLTTPAGTYRTQRWRIVSRHKPATVRATIDVDLGQRNCVLRQVRMTIAIEDHGGRG